jgi:norsolorinic acid ketoreductase
MLTVSPNSKAAANYLVVKIHHENPKLTSVAWTPGWLQTDMGNGAAETVGMPEAPVTVEEGVAGLVKQFDVATRETLGGKFFSYDGTETAW